MHGISSCTGWRETPAEDRAPAACRRTGGVTAESEEPGGIDFAIAILLYLNTAEMLTSFITDIVLFVNRTLQQDSQQYVSKLISIDDSID